MTSTLQTVSLVTLCLGAAFLIAAAVIFFKLKICPSGRGLMFPGRLTYFYCNRTARPFPPVLVTFAPVDGQK